MPPTVLRKRSRPPKDRGLAEGGCFYAGEAVRVAGIVGLNYRQLRRLFKLIKGEAPVAEKWVRFTFRDILALRVAYRLASGKRTKYPHKRLHFAEVEQACLELKRFFGISDPLTEVQLGWEGARIVARYRGVHFETASQQLLLVADSVTKRAGRVRSLAASERRFLATQLRADLATARADERRFPRTCATSGARAKIRFGGY
jgi:hypothetical protein